MLADGLMLNLTAPTGSSASRSSAPGTRRTLTSTGLTALMPPWMKVLSPQLITCQPPRISPGCDPRRSGTTGTRRGTPRGADAVLRVVRQRRAGPVAVLVGDVVEGEAADEAADVLVAELELAGDLRGVGEQPLLVVLVAVVAVDREGGPAGGDADDALVGIGHPEPEAVGQRVVPVPLEGGWRVLGRRCGLIAGRAAVWPAAAVAATGPRGGRRAARPAGRPARTPPGEPACRR